MTNVNVAVCIRRAIWQNLLPKWKRTFKRVEKITSGAFVSLWTERVNQLAKKFSAVEQTSHAAE